ncbi:hypothetical protein MBANPS3_012491 [Mucor bainieri]
MVGHVEVFEEKPPPAFHQDPKRTFDGLSHPAEDNVKPPAVNVVSGLQLRVPLYKVLTCGVGCVPKQVRVQRKERLVVGHHCWDLAPVKDGDILASARFSSVDILDSGQVDGQVPLAISERFRFHLWTVDADQLSIDRTDDIR